MIFPNRVKNPKIIMFMGMMCLAIAVALPVFVHPTARIGPDWMDRVRGLLSGIGIGMNLWSVILASRQRRDPDRRPH